MKKILALLLTLMLALSLAACGGNDNPDPSGSGTGQQGSEQTGQPSNSGGQSNDPNGEIDAEKWLDYLTDTYGLTFTQNNRDYWDDYYPASITEDDTDEAKTSVFKFEDMPMDMQNVLVGQMFTASAALSGNNNLDPASGAVIGESNDLYFYGDSDPSPTKAWNYTYNNAQYNISIALSSSKKVEMTVTAYKGDPAKSGGTPVAAGSYNGPFDDKWPDCVWTRLVPKPEFSEKSKEESYSAEALVNGFAAAYTDVTMDEAKEYVKAVQAAGFDQSITENGNDTLYYYMAFNEDHVKFELNLNPVLGTTILMK